MICVCATIIKLPVSYFLCSDRSCRMYHFFRLLSSFSRMFRAVNCVWCTHRWPRPEPSLSNLYCVTHFIRVRGNWNKWLLIFLRVALQGPTFKFMEMNMFFFLLLRRRRRAGGQIYSLILVARTRGFAKTPTQRLLPPQRAFVLDNDWWGAAAQPRFLLPIPGVNMRHFSLLFILTHHN